MFIRIFNLTARPIDRAVQTISLRLILVASLVAAGNGQIFGQSGQLVHLGDIIDVDVVGSTEYDWRGPITPEGFLDGFDQVAKQIFALCRSEEEIAAEIAEEYGRILREPKVRVSIIDRSNRAIARLDGAIRTPYRFRIQRNVRLNEMIVLAGGVTDAASGEIQLQRPKNLSCEGFERGTDDSARPAVKVIKIGDLLKGIEDANPTILSGDIVTILEAYPIYMIGGVNRPGSIDSRSQVTLSRAIAMAGGLSKSAESSAISIYRRIDGKTAIINVSLEQIDSGAAADPTLNAFDIVDVTERGRTPRRLPPDPDAAIRSTRTSPVQPPLKIID